MLQFMHDYINHIFNTNPLSKIFGLFFTFVMAIWMTNLLITVIKNNPFIKMEFIENAQKKNNITIGKLSFFSKNGNNAIEYYVLEYTYMINNKPYYVTYKVYPMEINFEADQGKLDGDVLAMQKEPTLLLYYNEKNPSKVMCKKEIFCSPDAMKQIKSNKENIWRVVGGTWTEPLDFITHD